MAKPETILDYLDAAGHAISWRRARGPLLLELRHHLGDQCRALEDEGKTPEEAERLAVEEMGDPEETGAALDALHRPCPQRGPLVMIVLLALAGGFLRVVLTAGAEYEAADPVSTLTAVALGTLCMVGMYFLDCSVLVRHGEKVYLLALAAGLLAQAYSPVVNNVPYYARYVVLTYPAVYALWVCRCRGGWKQFLLAAAGMVPLAGVCIAVPYVWALILLLATGLAVLLAAVAMGWFQIPRPLAGVVVCTPVSAVSLLLLYGGRQRLTVALCPELDPFGRGFQGMAVRRALAAAQWLGQGSIEQLVPYAPYERMTPGWEQDLLLTTLIYRLGWLAGLLAAAALTLLLLWLVVRCRRQRSGWGRLLALAVLLPFGMQLSGGVVLNLGVVALSVHIPLLVGNLHTVLDMALLGLALSVLRGDPVGRLVDCAPLEMPGLRTVVSGE